MELESNGLEYLVGARVKFGWNILFKLESNGIDFQMGLNIWMELESNSWNIWLELESNGLEYFVRA
jgi:hypothetical protein